MKKPTPASAAAVIPLFARPRFEGEDEVAVGVPPVAASSPSPVTESAGPAIDLSEKSKLWFTIGPGRSGKTTLLRWVSEVVDLESTRVAFAAVDPMNRSLTSFVEGVNQPPSSDPSTTAAWLEQLIQYIMQEQCSGLIDFGGGDTSLGRLVVAIPNLVKTLEEAGVAPVAVYTLSPRVDDLAALSGFETAGFQPAATLLVLNEGLGDPAMDRSEAFGRILRHSVLRKAVERGARLVWMPRLEAAVAAEIEAKRIRFAQARDGVVPAGKSFAPLGPFDRARVRRWWDDMALRFEPVRTWLP